MTAGFGGPTCGLIEDPSNPISLLNRRSPLHPLFTGVLALKSSSRNHCFTTAGTGCDGLVSWSSLCNRNHVKARIRRKTAIHKRRIVTLNSALRAFRD
jgi:hypothetical protein